jgi:hypothetical protein
MPRVYVSPAAALWQVLLVSLLGSLFFCGTGYTQDYKAQDDITNQQTNVGLNSIIDGQPGPPKKPFITMTFAGQERQDFQYEASIGYTPAEKGFFRNSLFSLTIPTLDVGEGTIDFEKSVSTSWLQRWHYEHNGLPTISTMISLQVPYGEPDANTDIVTTFIVTKNMGKKGVGYFNAYIESTQGIAFDNLERGLLLGYKRFLPNQKALFLDTLYQSTETLTFEVSLEIDLPKGWSISPGANISYDTQMETYSFGGGLLLFYQF